MAGQHLARGGCAVVDFGNVSVSQRVVVAGVDDDLDGQWLDGHALEGAEGDRDGDDVGASARMSFPVRAQPFVTQIAAAGSRQSPGRRAHVDGPERPSGRNASPSGITPSNIMSPAPEPTRGSWTEVRLGARAHTTDPINRAHASQPQFNPDNSGPRALREATAQVRQKNAVHAVVTSGVPIAEPAPSGCKAGSWARGGVSGQSWKHRLWIN